MAWSPAAPTQTTGAARSWSSPTQGLATLDGERGRREGWLATAMAELSADELATLEGGGAAARATGRELSA